jgi:integrase
VKPNETVSKAGDETEGTSQPIPRHLTYQKVRDGRKQPIRGLWVRNGRFYARLTVEDPNTGTKSVRRVPLEDAKTIPDAVMELKKLQTKREDNALPVLKQTPKFSDYVETYFAHFAALKDAKRPRTLETERGHLNRWKDHLKETRLDRITKPMIAEFRATRKNEGVSNRTVNLAVTCLRNVLNKAIDDGWLQRLPTENLRQLKWEAKKKKLYSAAEIDSLCQAALEVSKNGVVFGDLLRFLCYCGTRISETLRLKWSDVDWQQNQITIGSDGLSKNHKSRPVDFNPKLETLLKEMLTRRAPDSEYLFPSPQRGKKDKPAKTFRETLKLARDKVGFKDFGFHHCRHFFISYCVMCGIDYMTTARWVAHADGGILIGKVYGHLMNDHAKRQAQKLSFEPAALAG